MEVKGEEGLALSLPVSGVSLEMKAAPVIGRKTGPSRRSTKGGWTGHEDELLHQAVTKYNGRNWKKIAECFPNRTDVQCLHRWQKVLDPQLIKGPWSKEEDDLIMELVKEYGCTKWSFIAKSLPGRIGKQCRERWHNQLDPSITKEPWTREEEAILISAHQIYGNKWAEIAKQLPWRADNAIKNHWNSSVKKRLSEYASGIPIQQQGVPAVDPVIFASQERCPTTDRVAKRTTNPALAIPRLAGAGHLMTSNVNLVRQSATRGRLNLDLQLVPPGDSKCEETKFRPALPVPELTRERRPKTSSTDFVDRSTTRGTPNLDLELIPQGDSKCQEISTESSSVEDFGCIIREGGEAVLKQRPPMENHHCLPFKKRVIATPCRSEGVYGETNFGDGDVSERFKETTLSSSLICNQSDTDRLEDQAPSTLGNSGSLCAAELQLKDTQGCVSESYKENTLSSSLAGNPSNIDRLEDQAPTTPLYCTRGNHGFLCDANLQLKDTKGSIFNIRLSESSGNISESFKEATLSSSLACNPSNADKLNRAPTTPLFCTIGNSGSISDKLFSKTKGYVSESFKETTLSSSLACNPSDTDRLDDQVPTTPLYCASGNSGSLGDTDLQLKDRKDPISGKLFSDSKLCVSGSFKQTTLSSSLACNPSDTDRLGDQAPVTPLYSAKENSGSLCDAPLQLKDSEGFISDKLFLESKGYDRKPHSQFHCFTPADCILPSPLAVLRSLAKTFETPSIIRKRVYQSAEPVSTVISCKEIASAKDSSGVGDIYVNAKRVRNTLDSSYARKKGEINLAGFDTTDCLDDDDRSSKKYSKHGISGATKSLARKLDFNLVRADLRPIAR